MQWWWVGEIMMGLCIGALWTLGDDSKKKYTLDGSNKKLSFADAMHQLNTDGMFLDDRDKIRVAGRDIASLYGERAAEAAENNRLVNLELQQKLLKNFIEAKGAKEMGRRAVEAFENEMAAADTEEAKETLDELLEEGET